MAPSGIHVLGLNVYLDSLNLPKLVFCSSDFIVIIVKLSGDHDYPACVFAYYSFYYWQGCTLSANGVP